MSPYFEVPLEQMPQRVDSLIEAAHQGARIVVVRDGKPYAQIRPVNPMMSENAHWALESIRTFPAVQHDSYESWWAAVKPVHE